VRREKRRNQNGGKAAQDQSRGRRDMKRNFEFIEIERKTYKYFFTVEPLPLKPKNDYMKGCLTNESRTPYIAK